MVALRDIKYYCDAIAEKFQPERIILFGSHAYGTPTDESDVDVLVVMPKAKGHGSRPSLRIRQSVAAGFPVDILVRTPAKMSQRLRSGDSFITDIVTRGKVMYEAQHA